MTRLRANAAPRLAGPSLTISSAVLALAFTASVAHADLIGKWSAEQACGAQSREIVFRGNTMELWEASHRLFLGNVRFQTSGNQTAVTIVRVGPETPPTPGIPQVGDVATFRRDGNRLFGIAVTRNGQRQPAPDGTPPFYLCP
jgi:hypothetical protein